MGMKMDAYARYEAMQAALEAQMQAQGQSAGLRMLRQIMARMLKGEVGLRLEVWRTAMRDETRASELAQLQRELEARASDASKGAALRQLKQIMIRIMKGETAMRLEVWRMAMKVEKYAEFEAMQAALEAQMKSQGQGAGLRQRRAGAVGGRRAVGGRHGGLRHRARAADARAVRRRLALAAGRRAARGRARPAPHRRDAARRDGAAAARAPPLPAGAPPAARRRARRACAART